MKKFGLFLLGCMLVFVMAACSSNADEEVDSSANGSQQQTDNQIDTGKHTDAQRDTQTDTEQSSSRSENGKTVITFATFYENDLFKEAKRKYEEKLFLLSHNVKKLTGLPVHRLTDIMTIS